MWVIWEGRGGGARLLDLDLLGHSFPLCETSTRFVNETAPGPVLLMNDRLVNGMSAPDAIFVKKGNTYDFKLTLTGREPGRWHVHPTFAVEGAGTLIGPGQWVTVQDTGSFTNNLAGPCLA